MAARWLMTVAVVTLFAAPSMPAELLPLVAPAAGGSQTQPQPPDHDGQPQAQLTADEIRLLKEWAARVALQPQPTGEAPASLRTVQADEKSPAKDKKQTANGQNGGQAGGAAKRPTFDPQVVAAGQSAFNNSCTTCHDAERSTSKRKSLAGWIATVRRMAAKDGAEIEPGDFQPIATYLASLNPAAAGNGEAAATDGAAAAAEAPAFNLFGTVSLIHRSGLRPSDLENAGFFPEVWLGAEWNPTGVISGRIHACVSCHTENAAVSSRIELAEGFVRLDVDQLLCCCEDAMIQTSIDGGRFIVPFGAFAAMSHPGAYRTATRPLMYNMGQNIFRDDLGAPILPMPYSDEGIMVSANATLIEDINISLDAYAVNGLQGSTALDLPGFWSARDYVDNNSEPAVGGRLTVGNKMLRLGASAMSGRYNDNSPLADLTGLLDYKIYGVDATFRWEDLLRVTYEYARRDSDAFDFGLNDDLREALRGSIIEGELKLWEKPRISAVVRYDDQRRAADLPLPGSRIIDADFAVSRFTWGFNIALGSSTLLLNHERWRLPEPFDNEDVFAVRWVAAF
jgi:hypothetical protein